MEEQGERCSDDIKTTLCAKRSEERREKEAQRETGAKQNIGTMVKRLGVRAGGRRERYT